MTPPTKLPYFTQKTRPKSNGPHKIKWTNFVEQNKPKTMENKRPRSRRPRTKNPANRGKGNITANKHVTTINLSRNVNLKVAGKYMMTDWDETDAMNSVEGISIKEFNIVDCEEIKSIQAFDDTDLNICLFSKLSRRLCKQHMIQKKGSGLNILRKLSMDAMACKPEVLRGTKCGGENTAYKIFGIRKDPLSSNVGTYAFKAKTNNEKQKEVGGLAKQIVDKLEQAAYQLSKPFFLERSFVQSIRKLRPDGIGDLSTAFSIGRDYHSKCHIDNDYYYTVLTVVAPSKAFDDSVIYYFCFPEYSVKVPLRSGDVLMFNPQILHSCSNPKLKGSFIMSAYVSAKTIHSSA